MRYSIKSLLATVLVFALLIWLLGPAVVAKYEAWQKHRDATAHLKEVTKAFEAAGLKVEEIANCGGRKRDGGNSVRPNF